jgi:hypothetical protein
MKGKPMTGPCPVRLHPWYRRWSFMRQVCYNPNHADYKSYGARGIEVDPMFDDFWNFVDIIERKLGPEPYGRLSKLARIDQDGDYTIKNLKWDVAKQVGRRCHKAFKFKYKNKTKPLRDWCDEYNINIHTAIGRIERGWTPTQVLGLTPGPRAQMLAKKYK